jgi:hypothetical protein
VKPAESNLPPLQAAEWSDPWWRLTHLYWIQDKNGRPVLFKPNPEQEAFYRSIWYRNIILKARQLGFSTLMMIMALDQAMWVPNFNAGVIADTLPNAMKLFRKISFAYKRLPKFVRDQFPVKSMSASEIIFAHDSSISVGVSARGGTLQLLHVSELGKVAARHPDKAKEIVTGAFEAVPSDGIIVVESTAEGAQGEFYDLTTEAQREQAEGSKLTQLSFKPHFFPWHRSKEYRLDPNGVHIPEKMRVYFRELATKEGVKLDAWQQAWYVVKARTLKRLMKREYPSTPAEAFEAAIEGAIYGEEMATLRELGRITKVPLDPSSPVNTFWDFGTSDATAIWLHQRIGLTNLFIKYTEGNGRGLKHWWVDVLEEWRRENKARWGRHYLPHDANADIQGESVETKAKILQRQGMDSGSQVIVPRVFSIDIGINLTREAIVRDVWIDRDECADGIKCLDGYQYEWLPNMGRFSSDPLHNWASHGADAFRQFAQGFKFMPPEAKAKLAKFKNRDRRN